MASSNSLLNKPFENLEAEIHALSISESGERVVIVLKANEQNLYYAKVLNIETLQFLEDPVSLSGEQVLVQMLPNGQSFVTATTIEQSSGKYDSEVKLWTLTSPVSVRQPAPSTMKAKLKRTQEFKGEKISALAISANSHRLMVVHNRDFETIRPNYNVGGSGTLSVWDISPETVREIQTGLKRKRSTQTEGYIRTIALSFAQQEVALITHHAKKHKRLRVGQEQTQEIDAKNIISKIKTRNWEGQSTSKTLSFDKGQIVQFVGLMPDGENIVVGGHEIVSRTYQSGKTSVSTPMIKLLNKQSHQSFDLSLMAAFNPADLTDSTDLANKASTNKDPVNSDSANLVRDYATSIDQLTSLLVTTDGKHICNNRWETHLL